MWWLLACTAGLAETPTLPVPPPEATEAVAPAPAPPPPPPVQVVHPLPDATVAAMTGVTWREGCPVGPEDLALLRIRHHTDSGTPQTGELIVHRDVAEVVGRAFTAAWEEGFVITQMEPASAFGGSDDASMAADNTSAFNCRAVTGGTAYSRHSFGRAIDVNPLRNPYVSGSRVLPPEGRAWLDRSDRRPGMLHSDSALVRVLLEAGWGWGGQWSSKKDFQHVSESGR